MEKKKNNLEIENNKKIILRWKIILRQKIKKNYLTIGK